MSAPKLQQSIDNLEHALRRLEEILAIPLDNPLAVDGTIQRFKRALEITWKTLKRLLEAKGRRASFPHDILKEAYAVGWLDDKDKWLALLWARNETSHLYDEKMAQRI